jgi:hypothetical protein
MFCSPPHAPPWILLCGSDATGPVSSSHNLKMRCRVKVRVVKVTTHPRLARTAAVLHLIREPGLNSEFMKCPRHRIQSYLSTCKGTYPSNQTVIWKRPLVNVVIGENISKGKEADHVIIIGSLFPQASAVFCDPKWSQLALDFY